VRTLLGEGQNDAVNGLEEKNFGGKFQQVIWFQTRKLREKK
jgi:hypothetical protein